MKNLLNTITVVAGFVLALSSEAAFNREGIECKIRHANELENFELPGTIYVDYVNNTINLSSHIWGTHGGVRHFQLQGQTGIAIGFHFGNRYMVEIQNATRPLLPMGITNGTILRIGDAFGYGEEGDLPMIGKFTEVTLEGCVTH